MTEENGERISDTELASRARAGDNEAFAELWRRHAGAGRAIARSVTSSIEPDDLVAEAYGKIYALVKRGAGPTGAFRPYLAATIRNIATSIARARRETPMDFADELIDDGTSDEELMRQLDRDLTTTAFRALPDRWQQALWYSEVEDMSVQDCAKIFGIKPTAMAMLTYRAREGLRDAWIQAHLKSIEAGSEHEWCIERLSAYSRDRLGKRDSARLHAHLDSCEPCSAVADEAHFAASRLAGCLLPPLLGFGAAAAYLSQVADGSTAAYASGVAPYDAGAAVQNFSAGGTSNKSLQLLQTVVGSAAAVTLALAAGATMIDRSRPVPSSLAGERSDSRTPPVAPPSTPPPPTSSPIIETERLSVEIDSGRHGLFFPMFSGSAHPGSLIRISTPAAVVAEIHVDEDGHWASGQLNGISSGTLRFDNLFDGDLAASASTKVELKRPTFSSHRSGSKVTLTVKGVPGAGIAVISGPDEESPTLSAAILDGSGTWSATFESLPGSDELVARYAEGSRFGPSHSVTPSPR